MKIALAQLNYHIGNFKENTKKIISTIEEAAERGADLIVFSELSLGGYPALDFLAFDDFMEEAAHAAREIAGHCQQIACILGLPIWNEHAFGKRLYNAAYFIEEGEIKAIVRKGLLPNYDVFDEYRYFEPAREFQCVPFKGRKIALTICEDLWNVAEERLYAVSPMDRLIEEQPDLMINIAASPFHYCHAEDRLEVLRTNAQKYRLPLFYVNQVGAQTELVFDGGSMVFDKEGHLRGSLSYFEEDMQLFELEDILLPREAGSQPLAVEEDIAQIHDALVLGIRDYFVKSGFTKAVLGLSGGIDSAVVCALAAEALGSENVVAVLMPSQFSSDHSVKDALDLVEAIGCRHETIPIHAASAAFEDILAPVFQGLPFNLTEENIQARSRGVILMALSNKFGYVLLNTSNKSECAVGYGTLYGDMCGALSVIGDVYKTQVFSLARYINRERTIIPEHTLTKAPSAELRPDQKDSDSLPPYDVLDAILFQHIEKEKGFDAIAQQGWDPTLVQRILKMVNGAEFKRYQTAPILRVSPKAFGMGRRMPLVGKAISF